MHTDTHLHLVRICVTGVSLGLSIHASSSPTWIPDDPNDRSVMGLLLCIAGEAI